MKRREIPASTICHCGSYMKHVLLMWCGPVLRSAVACLCVFLFVFSFHSFWLSSSSPFVQWTSLLTICFLHSTWFCNRNSTAETLKREARCPKRAIMFCSFQVKYNFRTLIKKRELSIVLESYVTCEWAAVCALFFSFFLFFKNSLRSISANIMKCSHAHLVVS